jgi:hypothetical protein
MRRFRIAGDLPEPVAPHTNVCRLSETPSTGEGEMCAPDPRTPRTANYRGRRTMEAAPTTGTTVNVTWFAAVLISQRVVPVIA